MIKIRPLHKNDYDVWLTLYQCYAEHYRMELTDTGIATTWGWLNDPAHPLEGVIAELNGDSVGLAHFRAMPSPLRGREIGFLDDLVVLPEYRGSGAANALLTELDSIASARGWSTVRWITREDNHRARALYDKVAVKTDWALYEMTPGGRNEQG